MGERSEHNAGNIGELSLDGTCYGKGVIVGIARHTDNKVDLSSCKDFFGLGYR